MQRQTFVLALVVGVCALGCMGRTPGEKVLPRDATLTLTGPTPLFSDRCSGPYVVTLTSATTDISNIVHTVEVESSHPATEIYGDSACSNPYGGQFYFGDDGGTSFYILQPDETTITLRASTAQLHWDFVVQVNDPQWHVVPHGGPEGRSDTAAVYSPVYGDIFLYGGRSESQSVLADFWGYEGSVWSLQTTSAPPGPRMGHNLMFDTVRSRVLLFGGFDGSENRPELWAFDESWHLVEIQGDPPKVAFAAVAYDRNRDRVVVFGGQDPLGETIQDDAVYEFDGTTWSLGILPEIRPPPRDRPASMFSGRLGGFLIYGGQRDSQILDDAWLWNGITWTNLCTSCTGTPRVSASLVSYPPRADILLIGGTSSGAPVAGTRYLNATTFEPLSLLPTALSGATAVFFSPTQSVMLFGGTGPSCSGACGTTWMYDLRAP